MLHNLIYSIVHLPMVWDFIIPLAIIAIFCAILFWEGEHGAAAKKHFRVAYKKLRH